MLPISVIRIGILSMLWYILVIAIWIINLVHTAMSQLRPFGSYKKDLSSLTLTDDHKKWFANHI